LKEELAEEKPVEEMEKEELAEEKPVEEMEKEETIKK